VFYIHKTTEIQKLLDRLPSVKSENLYKCIVSVSNAVKQKWQTK